MKKRKLFRHCCTGYKPSPNRTTCVPVCEKPCKWGKCILPNQCQCDKLYAGDVCDKRIGINYENDRFVDGTTASICFYFSVIYVCFCVFFFFHIYHSRLRVGVVRSQLRKKMPLFG